MRHKRIRLSARDEKMKIAVNKPFTKAELQRELLNRNRSFFSSFWWGTMRFRVLNIILNTLFEMIEDYGKKSSK